MTEGTELYHNALAHDYGDPGRNALMEKVWHETPWMTNAYTGGHHNNMEREQDIRTWCKEHFGPEAFPIHGKCGNWQRGGATIHGWTWMGFATEQMMNQFIEAWPIPSNIKDQQNENTI